MTNTIHIMLDLETWGKRPGCDIRSIGACVFNPATGFVHDGSLGTIRPFYQATDNPTVPQSNSMMVPTLKYPLHRDPETVAWWNDQSDEAQAAFTKTVDLADGLHGFSAWLFALTNQLYDRLGVVEMQPSPNVRLWAHGPQFDCTILAAAYDACALPAPWHYRAPRDTRTIFDAAGIDDHSAWLAQHPGPLAIQHHALDDAICQARAVCAAFARLRSNAYRFTEDDCPGHVSDMKRCVNCGVHIDSLRPTDERDF